MSPSQLTTAKRPIRIGNSSGYTGDGLPEMYNLVKDGPIDAIFADYLAELNIPWRALEMMNNPELGYEIPALTQLGWMTAAEEIAKQGIKVVHDGGALNPYGLYKATRELLNKKGLGHVKVAWVEGDNVKQVVEAELASNPSSLPHLDIKGLDIGSIKGPIVSANAYIGMRGIVSALNEGAQIIICGRCCDASPLMGLAAWWHGCSETDYDKLASALVAGHITECGPYATGGNFCGFKALPNLGEVPGYPIAEIGADGSVIITKHEGTHGAVTVDTVTAQLVYEIQGPKYLNPDVVALLEDVTIEQVGKDRVKVDGVKGLPPPPTTKLAVCTLGGYQSEGDFFVVGLDLKEKVEHFRTSVLKKIDQSKFTKVSIETHGVGVENPYTQNDATVTIRVFLQAPTQEAIAECWKAVASGVSMGGYCGLHGNMDPRSKAPKPYIEFFPAIIPQSKVNLKVHMDDHVIPVNPVTVTNAFTGQTSYPPKVVTDLSTFGPTRRAPLGKVVLARSGDKAGNANVGLWVRNDDEWSWLQSFLTIDTFKTLLGGDYKPEYRIERFEMPHIRAVHFVTYGILQGGVSSSSIIDQLAKSFGEFIRARHVDIPVKFLERPAVGEYLH